MISILDTCKLKTGIIYLPNITTTDIIFILLNNSPSLCTNEICV